MFHRFIHKHPVTLMMIPFALTMLSLYFIPAISNANVERPLSDMTYLKTSERKAYPKAKDLSMVVNIKQNRVYIYQGTGLSKHLAYTMFCSAGKIDPKTGRSYTPTGNFTIQQERGDSFYNQDLNEGANHWTSFKSHGVYLFHSVPTDRHGNYKFNEARNLGKKPSSHGCIRLSVPDAQWIQTNVPAGTPVTIKEK